MNSTNSTLPNKLKGLIPIKGIITVKTGLHIGGTSNTIEIGGMDNPIIINPVTKEPYIPGSSLKGKMRSLLEWKLGKIELEGKKLGEPYHFNKNDKDNHPISRIFGTTDDEAKLGPTRLIVRDAFIDESYKKAKKDEKPDFTWNDMIEEKTENAINRITAKATPRPIQRVVTGTEFSFEIVYRVFDMGDDGNIDKEFFKYVLDGLKLIEMDALGGSGSRGCGKVEIKVKDKENNLKSLSEVSPEQFQFESFT